WEKHGMAAAVEMQFDGIDVEFGQEILEIVEDVGGNFLAAVVREELRAIDDRHGRVERENAVFLAILRLLERYPVRHHEIREADSGAPRVVCLVVNRAVKNHIDDWIRAVADRRHGFQL